MAMIEARDVATLATAVRAATDDIVVLLPADLDPLTMATMRAAIAPLAIERAPEFRVNAVVPGIDHDVRNVAEAIDFLVTATSTTGQILALN